MTTATQIAEYLSYVIAEHRMSGKVLELREAQRVAGFLREAAEATGDQQLAGTFRTLATEAVTFADELADSAD